MYGDKKETKMGFSIIEVKRIPHYSLVGETVADATGSLTAVFDGLLSTFSLSFNNETAVIEIVVLKEKNDIPRLLITLRGEKTILLTDVATRFADRLQSVGYSTELLNGQHLRDTILYMRSLYTMPMVAITKGEKLTPSQFSFSGSYYSTDVLYQKEHCEHEVANHNSLLAEVYNAERALVAFQVISTTFSYEERFALSSLIVDLANAIHGTYVNGNLIREPIAEDPYRTYQYYYNRQSQPVYAYNILVAAPIKDQKQIASAIVHEIQSSCASVVNLRVYDVHLNQGDERDLYNLPQNVFRSLFVARDPVIWSGTEFDPVNLARLPFLMTSEELSLFFRLPIDDEKIRGFVSNKVSNDNELLNEKQTPPESITIGTLRDSTASIRVSPVAFTRHTLVVGTPGSGKTTFALNLLLQFHSKGIPFLAIEPTKTEYRSLIDTIPELQVFTPGKNNIVPFILNPFIPPKGIRLEQYIPALITAFKAAFHMETPLDVIFQRAIRRCYALYGWKNSSSYGDEDVRLFGLYEFILVFKDVVSSSPYKADTKANLETGGSFRLMSLLDTNKYIFDTIHTLEIDQLLTKPTVIELNAISDNEQKALIMALLLIQICLITKEKGSGNGKINNVIMIDEAHVLLSNKSADEEKKKAGNATIESLQSMIAEIRSFGTGIIIADQVPSKVTSDIIANTDIKVSFRLVEQRERDIIGNSIGMSQQLFSYLSKMKRGEAITYYSDIDAPKIIQTRDIRGDYKIRDNVADTEIRERCRYWDSNEVLLVPYVECRYCDQCSFANRCETAVREQAEHYAEYIIASLGKNITDKNTLVKYMYCLHDLVFEYEKLNRSRFPIKKLCNCTKVQFLRSVLLQSNIHCSNNEVTQLLNKSLIKETRKNV